MKLLKAASLFASSGIGDLALRANGVQVLVANELLHDRASLFQANFPETRMIDGDIWEQKDQIVQNLLRELNGEELDFLLATPPCQGMSKNGQGKLLAEIRLGNRPPLDPRNRLIIPTIQIAKALQPRVLVLENVPEMKNTVIEADESELINIIDYISRELGEEYSGRAEVVEFADYGVPQRRQRLITIFSRDERLLRQLKEAGTLLRPPSHSAEPFLGVDPWVTVRDEIAELPPLDAREKRTASSAFHPLHRVPVLDDKKYWWISNTPPECGAFDNQCVNPSCNYRENPVHGSSVDAQGINKAKFTTPLFCAQCGSLLPRPYTIKDGEKVLMKGFTSAYRRMKWDKPSPTLTTNLSYPSSDQNIHPSQNRVLSLFEALKLHTVLDFQFEWIKADGSPATDSLIRDSIGESVPPRGLSVIFAHLCHLLTGSTNQALRKLENSVP